MKRKTLKIRKKIAHYEDAEINLQLIHESIPKTFDYTDLNDKSFNIVRNASYDSVEGIEVDDLVVDEETNQAIILFHIVSTLEKFRAFSYEGYEGRDSGIYKNHSLIWRHTEIPQDERIMGEYDENGRIEFSIPGTHTTHFESRHEVLPDKEDAEEWEKGWNRRYWSVLVEEPCHIEDLHHFFNKVFDVLDLEK